MIGITATKPFYTEKYKQTKINNITPNCRKRKKWILKSVRQVLWEQKKKALAKKAYKVGDLYFVNIETIDDLLKLMKEVNEEIILSYEPRDNLYSIEIYDDYRE